MKKVRIMLLSLLVLAVAGGAMAFKAAFKNPFCITATVGGSCPSSPKSCQYIEAKLTEEGTPVCTTATQFGTCDGVTDCTNLTETATD